MNPLLDQKLRDTKLFWKVRAYDRASNLFFYHVPIGTLQGKFAATISPQVVKVKEWVDVIGDNVEMSRYTGTTDKDGNDIFEGDIVEQFIQNEYGSFQKTVGIVEWATGNPWGYCIKSDATVLLGTPREVLPPRIIGNMYQNPDMVPKNL